MKSKLFQKKATEQQACTYCEQNPCACRCVHNKRKDECKQCEEEGWGEPYEH